MGEETCLNELKKVANSSVAALDVIAHIFFHSKAGNSVGEEREKERTKMPGSPKAGQRASQAGRQKQIESWGGSPPYHEKCFLTGHLNFFVIFITSSFEGIWPEGADGTDINACCRSNNCDYIVTGDDFGQVNFFNFPSTRPKVLYMLVASLLGHWLFNVMHFILFMLSN